jgi:serine/threonine-protein kinase RsbW
MPDSLYLTEPFPRSNGDIELRLLADLAQLAVLRAVAGTMATHAEFDIDRIADIRMFVDEMASTLVKRAIAGSAMRLRLRVDDTALVVRGDAQCATTEGDLGTTFGWQIMQTLADGVNAGTVEPDEPGTPALVFLEARFLRHEQHVR